MQQSNTRRKRQTENQLQDDLQWYQMEVDADSWDDMMYREWQSRQYQSEGETVCEVQWEDGFVILLHHGPNHVEAANYLTDAEWMFGEQPNLKASRQ